MTRRTTLMIIDPQDSFCNATPTEDNSGELCVPGAWEAMERVAQVVDLCGGRFNGGIQVTLDSHHLVHIAHPIYWRHIDSTRVNARHPNPFTMLTLQGDKIMAQELVDPANGTFEDRGEVTTTHDHMRDAAIEYLTKLAAANRFPHFLWPPHCLIGTPGHNVIAPVMRALKQWEADNIAAVDYTTKGSYFHAEHFGAVQAQVPDPNESSTQLNRGFINSLMVNDLIIGCGIAGSHCLGTTVMDIANPAIFADGEQFIKKFVWLSDGTAPVPGFEQQQDDIVADLQGRGMQVMTCQELVSDLVGSQVLVN